MKFRLRAVSLLAGNVCAFLSFYSVCSAQLPLESQTSKLLSTTIPVPNQPTTWSRLSTPVATCKIPPVINGRLDDPCWHTATHGMGFYLSGGSGDITSDNQTEVFICADKQCLYIAFHCLDSHPDSIRASETVRGGDISKDDRVGVDIDSQDTHHSYSTFLVSARGTQSETIEGGTTDNITWTGDWKAATQRVPGGWTAEMSIPFALLKYPRHATTFGIYFYRYVSRNLTTQYWPYLPPDGTFSFGEAEYMNEFVGLAPQYFPARPTFLPYSLMSAGDGTKSKEGLDIKYPLTTTITGVATLFPDFQTIEQDVANVNFSYTEKFLNDNRPFFAEGASFLPESDVFYSRSLKNVDEGLKVVGKQGNTTIGALATNASDAGSDNAYVVNLKQDLGSFNNIYLNYAESSQTGNPSTTMTKLGGIYGWRDRRMRYDVQAYHAPTWRDGTPESSEDYLYFENLPPLGKVGYFVQYTDIGPTISNDIGFIPEIDKRGFDYDLEQFNRFNTGRIQSYFVDLNHAGYSHHTGGLFHNDTSGTFQLQFRDGLAYEVDFGQSDRAQVGLPLSPTFHDRTGTCALKWAQTSLYNQGAISETFGRVKNQAYNFLILTQGASISRSFSVVANYDRLYLGGATTAQAVVTGMYHINEVSTAGGRVVSQDKNTDVYFSFRQQVRSGADIYVLLGEPNSIRTRGIVQLKVIRPF